MLRADFYHDLVSDIKAGSRMFFTYSGGPPSSGQCASLAEQFATGYSDNMAALLSNSYSLEQVLVTDLSSTGAAYGAYSTPVDGGRGGSPLPLNVCALINYAIGRKYRGGKPRGYWPLGVISDLENEQQWSTTFQTEVNSGFGDFVGACQAASDSGVDVQFHYSVGYYSNFTIYYGSGGRAKNRATKLVTPNTDKVTNHALNLTIGSQRRRLRAAG